MASKKIKGTSTTTGVIYEGRTTRVYTHLVVTSVYITEEYRASEIAHYEARIAEATTEAAVAAVAKVAAWTGPKNDEYYDLANRAMTLEYRASERGQKDLRECLADAETMLLGWKLDDVARAGRPDLAAKAHAKAIETVESLKGNTWYRDGRLTRHVEIVECEYLT